jgi:hypothetical protein
MLPGQAKPVYWHWLKSTVLAGDFPSQACQGLSRCPQTIKSAFFGVENLFMCIRFIQITTAFPLKPISNLNIDKSGLRDVQGGIGGWGCEHRSFDTWMR